MVNTSGAAVLPKEAFFFSPKRHKFHFEELNAFTAQIRENKIDFFYGGKFHGMLFQLFSFLHYAVKYMWARLYRKKRTFCH
jgi:hypothetical protein